MAEVEGKKSAVVKAAKSAKNTTKKKTGAARRTAQKRVGKPAASIPADYTTPAKAEKTLYALARSQLAAGRTLRTTAAADVAAYEDIDALCRLHAADLKKRAVPPNMVVGAGLIAKRLAKVLETPLPSEPHSTQVQLLWEYVAPFREGLNRSLHGSRNAEVRKLFGLHESLYPIGAKTMIAAAQGLISGAANGANTDVAGVIGEDDVAWMTAQIRVVRAEAAKTEKVRKDRVRAGVSQTTERDILTAALEFFYDKYATGIMVALKGDPVGKVDALKLIPRREERRKGEESGGGTGPA